MSLRSFDKDSAPESNGIANGSFDSDRYYSSLLTTANTDFHGQFESLIESLVRAGPVKNSGTFCRFIDSFCDLHETVQEEKIHVMMASLNRMLQNPRLKENTLAVILPSLKQFWQVVETKFPTIFPYYAWNLVDLLIGWVIGASLPSLDMFNGKYVLFKSTRTELT